MACTTHVCHPGPCSVAGAWGNYAAQQMAEGDGEDVGALIARGRGAREGRVARRARRREALRVKREAQLAERRSLKAAMREAMAKLEALEEGDRKAGCLESQGTRVASGATREAVAP